MTNYLKELGIDLSKIEPYYIQNYVGVKQVQELLGLSDSNIYPARKISYSCLKGIDEFNPMLCFYNYLRGTFEGSYATLFGRFYEHMLFKHIGLDTGNTEAMQIKKVPQKGANELYKNNDLISYDAEMLELANAMIERAMLVPTIAKIKAKEINAITGHVADEVFCPISTIDFSARPDILIPTDAGIDKPKYAALNPVNWYTAEKIIDLKTIDVLGNITQSIKTGYWVQAGLYCMAYKCKKFSFIFSEKKINSTLYIKKFIN